MVRLVDLFSAFGCCSHFPQTPSTHGNSEPHSAHTRYHSTSVNGSPRSNLTIASSASPSSSRLAMMRKSSRSDHSRRKPPFHGKTSAKDFCFPDLVTSQISYSPTSSVSYVVVSERFPDLLPTNVRANCTFGARPVIRAIYCPEYPYFDSATSLTVLDIRPPIGWCPGYGLGRSPEAIAGALPVEPAHVVAFLLQPIAQGLPNGMPSHERRHIVIFEHCSLEISNRTEARDPLRPEVELTRANQRCGIIGVDLGTSHPTRFRCHETTPDDVVGTILGRPQLRHGQCSADPGCRRIVHLPIPFRIFCNHLAEGLDSLS